MGRMASNTEAKEKSASSDTAPGVNQLTDQVIASDLLISANTGVTIVARAITAASTPDIRIMLSRQLEQATAFQEQIGAYIADRGWVKAGDMKAQLELDVKKTQETLDMLR